MGDQNDTLNLDQTQAHAAKASIADVVQGMRTNLGVINEHVGDARAYWGGEANDSFTRAANDWDAEGAKLNQLLDELEQTLTSGYKLYEAGEQDIAGEMGKIQGSLGNQQVNL